MDAVRLGRVIRALRIRRAWRQLDVADKAGVSQSLIARVERGGAGRVRLDTLDRIVQVVEARLTVRVDWNGEAADRLLDADHAQLVEQVLVALRAARWNAIPEVTFNVYGERGSIDVLGWHAPTPTVLVVEAKTVVPDVQSMLAAFDRKLRLADGVAQAHGWRPSRVWSLLAIAESRTSRRRVHAHAATFETRFPHRAREARRAIAQPRGIAADAEPLRALWFLPSRTRAGRRQRVVRSRAKD
jgi:transcriptional regulator with XRE-family HTH domain